MADWNFTDLVEQAGYSSVYCTINEIGDFETFTHSFINKTLGIKVTTHFQPEKIELACDRLSYVKKRLDHSHHSFLEATKWHRS